MGHLKDRTDPMRRLLNAYELNSGEALGGESVGVGDRVRAVQEAEGDAMTPDERRIYIREYMRERRREWRADGLCVMCGGGVNASKPHRKTCDRCSWRSAESQRRKRESEHAG